MFGRFGRRRFDAPPAGMTSERSEAATSTTDLLSLLQTIEAAASEATEHGPS